MVLRKGGMVTRRSKLEYVEAVRSRYFRASKKMKGLILGEFTATTGLHRKAAIRLLNRRRSPEGNKGRGRPCIYGFKAKVALKVMWEATDRLCSKRLQPFVP